MKTPASGRVLLIACFGFLLTLFTVHMLTLGRKLSPDAVRAELEAQGNMVALPDWEVTPYRCPRGPSRTLDCAPAGEPARLTFPGPQKTAAFLSSRGSAKERTPAEPDAAQGAEALPNAVSMRVVLDARTRAWLSDKRMVTLVLPRSVQNRVRLESGGQVWETTGVGVSAQIPVAAADLLAAGEVKAELFFSGLPWFGPADHPPALVRNESVDTYVSFPLRSVFASELPNVLLMGFPVLLVALALVLDHSLPFLALSLYGATRAARAFLGSLIASGDVQAPAFAYTYLALDGLVTATLLVFILLFCSFRKRLDALAVALLAGLPAAFLGIGVLMGAHSHTEVFALLKSSDLWADVVASTLALPCVVYAFVTAANRGVDVHGRTGLPGFLGRQGFRPRVFLVALGLTVHLAGALADLMRLGEGGSRQPLDATHHALLPLLIVATLFSVGSVTKRMTHYAGLMKGRLETLLVGTRNLSRARGTLQAFSGALKVAVEEIPALRAAHFEIVVGGSPRDNDESGAPPSSAGEHMRYVVSGEGARASQVPLFEGFVDAARAAALRGSETDMSASTAPSAGVTRDGPTLHFPLWHGDVWKATISVSSPGAKETLQLTHDEEEFLSTLFVSLAITLENLGTLEALERADRLKDEFLANTSHELRTPLTGIIGLTEGLLAKPLSSQDEKAVTKTLSLVVGSARRLSNLVGDILDFSKLRENTLDLQRRPVSLSAAAEMAVELCRPLASGKSLSIRTEVPDDLPAVLADENRLQQILCNLVGNAVKFTAKGHVVLRAEARGDTVVVHVEDTGPGIPEHEQARIFESFVQGSAAGAVSLSREHGGTGLGLAVSKRLVELHRGTLTVESRLGVGSTFTFTLPASPLPAESALASDAAFGLLQRVMENPHGRVAHAPAAEGPSGSLAGTRILVVDDEAVNREVLKMQLELEGCEVFLASLGDEALAFLERERVDCVLLDLMLPRRNGFDVCRAIRRTHEASTLPVILLTAKNQVSDLVTAFECGANDFLSKPFSRKELLARLRNHLELARTHIAYARFVPNDLLALLGKAHISEVRLGDQVQRDMAILFLDIRGFTRLSEQLSAKATFDFLNAYFDTINPVVTRHRGFIDKYIGDAVMALFPVDPADALRAGIDLLAEVRAFNQRNEGRGLPAIRIGVGAHGGKLMLGTIGHADRMEGTVISETVNLASRLEGMSKAFGVGLVASRSLVDALVSAPTEEGPVDMDSLWRPLGRVRAKGSSRTLEVAEVFAGDDEALRERKRASRGALEKALALFEARAFESAQEAFEAIAVRSPDDGLVNALAREARRLAREGVPSDWDGAIHFAEK